jgi:hypothetical protein
MKLNKFRYPMREESLESYAQISVYDFYKEDEDEEK